MSCRNWLIDVRLPTRPLLTCLQWLDRILTWTLQATSTWQNRIKSNHCILFQINRMFHFYVCVLFKFDGQNSNLKRTNKQSLLKDFFWGFLKRNIFWISLRLFKLAFITLQIFWLLTLKANYYLFMVVNLLGLNLNRGCCDLVDRKIINLGAKCLEFISQQVLLKVF